MAVLPLFFHNGSLAAGEELWLEEDTARHIVQVLRMQPGEQLELTDGKGHIATATIAQANKKKCSVTIGNIEYRQLEKVAFHLGIAFTKNASRNEWLLEKATELGVRSITPLVTARTEREKVKTERWNNILVSAMLQSRQAHLPVFNAPALFASFVSQSAQIEQKLIAHCIAEMPRKQIAAAMLPVKETLILIGPEGDFTADEVNLSVAAGFTGISLSDNRLRTETAAMSVCAYFNLLNHDEN